jgi:hypothetical protein
MSRSYALKDFDRRMALRCLPQHEQAFHLTTKNECLSLESVEGPEFSAAHQTSLSFGAVKFRRCIISEAYHFGGKSRAIEISTQKPRWRPRHDRRMVQTLRNLGKMAPASRSLSMDLISLRSLLSNPRKDDEVFFSFLTCVLR